MAILAAQTEVKKPPLVKTAPEPGAIDDGTDHCAEIERLREALDCEIAKRKQVLGTRAPATPS